MDGIHMHTLTGGCELLLKHRFFSTVNSFLFVTVSNFRYPKSLINASGRRLKSGAPGGCRLMFETRGGAYNLKFVYHQKFEKSVHSGSYTKFKL